MKAVRDWSALLLSALALAGTIIIYIAGNTASARVAPLEGRVSVLEAQRVEDKERLGRIETKIDRVEAKIDRVLAR